MWGQGTSVGISTRYGLDGPADRIPVGARFSAPVQTGPGEHSASCTMGTWYLTGVNWPRLGVDHPPPSSAEVEGRVELNICSLSGPSLPFLWRTLTLITGPGGRAV